MKPQETLTEELSGLTLTQEPSRNGGSAKNPSTAIMAGSESDTLTAETVEVEQIASLEKIIETKGDVGADDAVKMYLKEIGKVKLLDKENEQAISKRMGEGCLLSKQKLAVANLRLVVSIAKKYTAFG